MIKIQYFMYFGRVADIKQPKRFSEKLQWYKLNYRDPLMTKCVDKVCVRDFVRERGLSDILTTEYAVYHSAEDIEFEALPEKFVAKYNNGAQRNLIVRSKKDIHKADLVNKLTSWMSAPLSKLGREWSYYDVVGKILVEEYLEPEEDGDLTDYKFFCFNGEPMFLYVLKDRFLNDGLKLGVYDTQFNKLDVYRAGIKKLHQGLAKPKDFERMLDVVRKLAVGFPHVRVDLYNIDGRIVFGELTFYDGSGYISYEPDEFDFKVGSMFKLP
ncbi:ATP-grasp fold amidoligase family protein [Halopseudomonas pelagia]|nr:ATP-grasp fold amidoligase family protein [Halopseudomonas pelagia]